MLKQSKYFVISQIRGQGRKPPLSVLWATRQIHRIIGPQNRLSWKRNSQECRRCWQMGPVTWGECPQWAATSPPCIKDTRRGQTQLLQVSHEGQQELRVTQGMAEFLFRPWGWLRVLDPSGWTPPLLSQSWALRLCWWPPCSDSQQCPGRGAAASHHGTAFPSADGIGNKLPTG